MSHSSNAAATPDAPAFRSRGLLLTVLLTLVCAALAAALLAPGILVTVELENDVLHLMDAVGRRDAGQLAHLDFITPLGDLSIELMALWRRAFDAPVRIFGRGKIGGRQFFFFLLKNALCRIYQIFQF